MQHDEVIWQVIRHNHCSYMAKITSGNFCRNPYNVTGVCNRSSCPLANSRYATIRDHDGSVISTDTDVIEYLLAFALLLASWLMQAGVFYLYMKSIERAHMPNKLWERLKLPKNYGKALEIIDKHMMYWPKFLLHKIKQRLTKMTQMQIRMRKLALKTREKIMTIPRKEKKREARREEKAEKAAVLEKNIEKELLERLKRRVYDGIYNYPGENFIKAIDKEIQDQREDEEEEEEEEEADVEYIEGFDEPEEEDMEDFDAFRESLDDAGMEEEEEEEEEEEVFGKSRGKRRNESTGGEFEVDGKMAKNKAKVLVEIEAEGADERERLTF